MTAPELKPCPFCGDPMQLWDHDTHARHVNTETKCPIRHQAIWLEYWNTRPTPLAVPEVAALVEALTLAANRLQRCAVDYDTGSHEFIETGEWAEEARAAIAAAKGGA